jgi:hypothetical protein
VASLQTRTLASGDTTYRVVFRIHGKQRVLTYSTAHAAETAIGLLGRHGTEAGYAILGARSTEGHVPDQRHR